MRGDGFQLASGSNLEPWPPIAGVIVYAPEQSADSKCPSRAGLLDFGPIARLRSEAPHWAGMVMSGRFSFSPESASVNNIIINANNRFVFRSRSSIQNQ